MANSDVIDAANAAIDAAMKVGGPKLDVRELLAGIIAIAATTPGYTDEARIQLAARLAHEASVLLLNLRDARCVDAKKTKR